MQIADRLQHLPIALFTMITGTGGLTLAREKSGETRSISELVSRTLPMLSASMLLPLIKTGIAIRRGKILAAED